MKVTGKTVELKRQYTGNVAAMTEEETYATPKLMLIFAIVLTCLWFITTLKYLSGTYGYVSAFVTTMDLVIHPVFLAGLWLEVAEKKEKINKRWVRYIQAVLLVVMCTLLVASYLFLL